MSVILATFREMAKGKKERKKIDEAEVMKKLGKRIRQLRIACSNKPEPSFAKAMADEAKRNWILNYLYQHALLRIRFGG